METYEESVELTRTFVKIESTNPGTEEAAMREAILAYLKDTSCEIQLDDVGNGRKNVIATLWPENTKEESIKEKYKEVPMFIFICHMDTVVVGEGWTKNPFGAEIEEQNGILRMYGRGSCDMKSGLACALATFKKTARRLEKGEISLKCPLRMICTIDEEGDMTGSDHIVEQELVKKEDYVLDLEPTDGEIQMAHKGRLWFHVHVKGITAHASKPEKGADAIFAASKFIVQIQEIFEHFPVHEELGYSTITFGQIQGGYQPYVVPDACTIFIDCRLAPPVTDQIVVQHFNKIIKEIETQIPGIKISYDITGNRPYIEKNPDSILLKNLKEAVEAETKQKAVVKAFTGYTDTAVIAGRLHNTECMSYGPGSLQYAHKPDEFVEIRDIIRCEKVMNHLVMSLCEER